MLRADCQLHSSTREVKTYLSILTNLTPRMLQFVEIKTRVVTEVVELENVPYGLSKPMLKKNTSRG